MDRKRLEVTSIQKVEIDAVRFLKSASARGIMPFIGSDSSVGMEYELQVAVEGNSRDVDLPIVIRNSKYYKNIVKRSERGDLSSECVDRLDTFLGSSDVNTWENSWVRVREERLSLSAKSMLFDDFLKDKKNPEAGKREDVKRFYCTHNGRRFLRLPMSYLLKLSLRDVLSRFGEPSGEIERCGKSLLKHFTSDNTSPEILSFTIPHSPKQRLGDLAADETARTYLVCQLLIQYANERFGLIEEGQKCHIYFAPLAPLRQKLLNDLIPDGYYRHLFMSPCLSGWDRGEEKHQYMGLCHKTLSRSQLNTIGKLKDAGILTNNLITLPNTSNTCLANNGIHVSLGSKVLSSLRRNGNPYFSPGVEKYFGDLAIKIAEHFLPLFVGTYSSAPYRIDFRDFHPEKVLGFMPHQLDYTHLRMIWRRWKKKANLGFLGQPLTPFGPRLLDTIIGKSLRLKGDIIPDFRLVDYLVCLLSTDSSPALNGAFSNQSQLKEELTEMGVFDSRMSIYLPYRQRQYDTAGYSGFEGRNYSLFYSILDDMAEAVELQNLITALAYKYIIKEQVRHVDIPDTPFIESERRQVFFTSAIGVPTFYVRSGTGNRFMRRILNRVPHMRRSNRYRGYLRVKLEDYRIALIEMMRDDLDSGLKGMDGTMLLESLRERLLSKKAGASDAIINGVLKTLGSGRKVLSVDGQRFNEGAERYYRKTLKKNHVREGLMVLAKDCGKLTCDPGSWIASMLNSCTVENNMEEFVTECSQKIIDERADEHMLRTLLALCLAVIHQKQKEYAL